MASTDDPRYHKEVHLFLEARKKLPEITDQTMEGTRDFSRMRSRLLAGNADFDGSEREVIVPSCHNVGGLPVSVYTPSSLPAKPSLLVYFHGGGFVVGSRISCEVSCKIIARKANCIVLNAEYRLAPENKMPAPIDDAAEVVTWVLENKVSLGGSVDSYVGVGGDSAGGTIAAQVCHEVPGINYQILIYPKLDHKLDRPSANEFKDNPVVPTDLLQRLRCHKENGAFSPVDRVGVDGEGNGHCLVYRLFIIQTVTIFNSNSNQSPDYLPLTHTADHALQARFISMAFGDDYKGVRGMPLAHEKFDHLPPALFILAECDPLRDDSYDYEKKLKEAGVKTELMLLKGMIHLYFWFPGIFKETTELSFSKVAEFIKQHS